MKSFTLPYGPKKKKQSINVWVGEPSPFVKNPIFYQLDWFWRYRNIVIAQKIVESFKTIKAVSDKDGCSFQDLLVYSISPEAGTKQDTPLIWQYFWCDQLCNDIEDLRDVVARFSWHLFGQYRAERKVKEDVSDHWYDAAEHYFAAIMTAVGIQERLIVQKVEYWDYFQHLSECGLPNKKGKKKYEDMFEDECYQICCMLDLKGMYIPADIFFFLGEYRSFGLDTTRRVNAIIREVIHATAKNKNLVIKGVPDRHSKAFLKFCKGFDKAYGEKIKNLNKPKKGKGSV